MKYSILTSKLSNKEKDIDKVRVNGFNSNRTRRWISMVYYDHLESTTISKRLVKYSSDINNKAKWIQIVEEFP